MTEDDIIDFVRTLPGAAAVTVGPADGGPEIAWGDTFFFYDTDGRPEDRKMPFATIVTKDYTGFDTASNVDRPGVFRLNVHVGRTAFAELLGYPPAEHAERSDGVDYTVLDRVIPHPVYAAQGWVSVLNPGAATDDVVRSLLTTAHEHAAVRHERRAAP